MADNVMEHWRPTGLSAGYFCMRCGDAVGMYGHPDQKCQPNPELVDELCRLNTEEAQKKREFLEALSHGK